jgi:hypothetical protein
MPDIDEIADELYGLPPEDFTAARTQYEKEAKAAGDRDGAARIHALAKPSVTAWLANQLAREQRDSLEPLLELGAGLRDATRKLEGDQLRALSRQQHQLVHALVQQARQVARAAGRSVSEDAIRGLDETLRAALADEQAARLLLAGHLTDALHSSDFGSGFGSGLGAGDIADVIPISRKARAISARSGSRQSARLAMSSDNWLSTPSSRRDERSQPQPPPSTRREHARPTRTKLRRPPTSASRNCVSN